MITITPIKLYSLILNHKIIYLTIYDLQGNQLFRSYGEGITPEIVVKETKVFLEDFPKGNILHAEARDNYKAQVDRFFNWHVIDEVEETHLTQPTAIQSVVKQGFTLEDVKDHVRAALEEHESKRKVEELRKDVLLSKKELEIKHKEIEGWAGKASIGLGYVIENLMKNSKLGALLGSIPNQNNIQTDTEMTHDLQPGEVEKVEKSVDLLLEVFTPEEFEAISKAIASNPDKKALILGFLK
jgi:hypothetical protein